MNIFSDIKRLINNSINKKFLGLDKNLLDKITCERPKDISYGDISSNAALIIFKHTEFTIDKVAKILIKELKKESIFTYITFQKPGFINMQISKDYWLKLLVFINSNKKNYGFKNYGGGKRINLEFVSANPTGPLHIGHVRGAVYGDVLANLLSKNGYDVTKEYYINDLGNQIEVLADTIKLHIKNYINNSNEEIADNMYKGKYLKDIAIKIYKDNPGIIEDKTGTFLKEKAVEYNINIIIDDLKKLGIKFDKFSSEKELHANGTINNSIKFLQEKKLIYQGKLDKPKGIENEEWSPKDQMLFKSSSFGDVSDRAIRKNDGTWTYFASDIAYHYDKARRGYSEIINIWGADHAGYVKRLDAAIKAFNYNSLKFTVKLCQIVNLIDKKKIIKMSKRAGNFILLSEVVDCIGKDALRFFMLIRKNDAHLDFDLEKCLEETKENPVFYVQYAYARINSIKRLVREKKLLKSQGANNSVNLINTEQEINIIKTLSIWPRIIESSVFYREPHRVVFYLIELASTFHSFWNMGNSDSKYKILCEDNIKLTTARLTLIEAVKAVLENGLNILSIEPAEKM